MTTIQRRLGVAAFTIWMLAIVGCQLLKDEERSSPEVLGEGRLLNLLHCESCHELHAPESLTDSQWVSVVRDMGRRAQLTPIESEKLLAWMQWSNDYADEDQRETELEELRAREQQANATDPDAAAGDNRP